MALTPMVLDYLRVRQQRGKLGELIGREAACQSTCGGTLVKTARQFLRAKNVEVAQCFCFAHDASEDDAAIHTASPLNVPVNETHDVLPSKAMVAVYCCDAGWL
ncbi:hypothetical protein J2797_005094 [Paraburkholderia terricola]|nr:hypothetical protein [Paraburkholderia terricola]